MGAMTTLALAGRYPNLPAAIVWKIRGLWSADPTRVCG